MVKVAKVKHFSVIIPFNKDKTYVLLGRKKRGLGEGLWNGFGGKPEKGETISQCAYRELKEECGLVAKELVCAGVLYMEDTQGPAYHIPVYTGSEFTGEVFESDEMEPKWFAVSSEIPYSEMYEEARIWWPTLFKGDRFIGYFYFDGEKLGKWNIESVDEGQIQAHLDAIDKILLADAVEQYEY
ncbi:hypothetical protein GGI07_004332 [Coemansia sp. Benny D115]|nr:hypothetical protein GGI07_004332 [Coemansia sp. Benny D115]